ncbi:MAG: hypothetical protein AMXMBFR7_37710 [Planctomycetota bacterium]
MGLDYIDYGNRNDPTGDQDAIYWVVTDGEGYAGKVLRRIPIGRHVGKGRYEIFGGLGGDFIADDKGIDQLHNLVMWGEFGRAALSSPHSETRLNEITRVVQTRLLLRRAERHAEYSAEQIAQIADVENKDSGRWLGAIREQERQGKWYYGPNVAAYSFFNTLSIGALEGEDVYNLGQYDRGRLTGGERAVRTILNTGRAGIGGALSVSGLRNGYEGIGINWAAKLESAAVRTGPPVGFESVEAYKAAWKRLTARESAPSISEGAFSITELGWQGYPSYLPRPQGPFKLLQGAEYEAARDSANAANASLRAENPGLRGWEVHEIQPVKWGGSPTDIGNKMPLPPYYHRSEVTPWWNNIQKEIERLTLPHGGG